MRRHVLLVLIAAGGICACHDQAPRRPEGPPRPRVQVPAFQTTAGSGDVRAVRAAALDALDRGRYSCVEMGGPLRNGVVVIHRVLQVDIAGQTVEVQTINRDQSLILGEVVFGPPGARLQTLATERKPLSADDTAAAPILEAAPTVPCLRPQE